MKKKTLFVSLILLCLLLLVSCDWIEYEIGKDEYEKKEYDSNGALAKITHYLTVKFGKEEYIDYIIEYNSEGQKTKETLYRTWFDAPNSYSIGEKYAEILYFANGKVSKELRYWTYGLNDTRITIEYGYDLNGNEILLKEYYKGSLETWIEQEYNSNGIRTRRIEKYTNGNIKLDQEYDSSKRVIKEIKGTTEGTISSWTEKEYNSDGKICKETSKNSDGSVSSWTATEYGPNDKKKVTLYDGNNVIISEVEYISGNISSKSEYENGVLKKQVEHAQDGSKTENYFDSDGTVSYSLIYEPGNFRAIKKLYYSYYSQTETISSISEYALEKKNSFSDTKEIIRKTTGYNKDGTIKYITEYTSTGALIDTYPFTSYNPDGSKSVFEYYPNTYKLMVSTIYYPNGKKQIVTYYDKYGKTTRIENYNKDGSLEGAVNF